MNQPNGGLMERKKRQRKTILERLNDLELVVTRARENLHKAEAKKAALIEQERAKAVAAMEQLNQVEGGRQ